ncbi:MAG: hypothetical protein R3311_14065 [Oceanisphaera sp.]|nr:hypothetical protein [Oceanisphaera sp.]
MLEFIFFHLDICKLFTRFVEQLGVEYEIKDDGETITVLVPDDLDDSRVEQLEDEYDRLLDISREQTDRDEGESRENYQKASLLITLNNGEKSYAHVDMDLINRALRNISMVEFNTLVEAIVDAVENPDNRSYCQIINDGEQR